MCCVATDSGGANAISAREAVCQYSRVSLSSFACSLVCLLGCSWHCDDWRALRVQMLDKKSSLSADSSNNRGLRIVFIITFKQTPSSILISSPSPRGGRTEVGNRLVIRLEGHGTNVPLSNSLPFRLILRQPLFGPRMTNYCICPAINACEGFDYPNRSYQ